MKSVLENVAVQRETPYNHSRKLLFSVSSELCVDETYTLMLRTFFTLAAPALFNMPDINHLIRELHIMKGIQLLQQPSAYPKVYFMKSSCQY